MLKDGIMHPQIARVLGELGHKDTLVISDSGLPIPPDVERVDLAWKPNNPRYLDVLEEILQYIVVEKVVLAEELKVVSPQMQDAILKLLPDKIEIEYIPHIDFKEETKKSRAVIRTGEFTPYPSIILVCGCAY